MNKTKLFIKCTLEVANLKNNADLAIKLEMTAPSVSKWIQRDNLDLAKKAVKKHFFAFYFEIEKLYNKKILEVDEEYVKYFGEWFETLHSIPIQILFKANATTLPDLTHIDFEKHFLSYFKRDYINHYMYSPEFVLNGKEKYVEHLSNLSIESVFYLDFLGDQLTTDDLSVLFSFFAQLSPPEILFLRKDSKNDYFLLTKLSKKIKINKNSLLSQLSTNPLLG